MEQVKRLSVQPASRPSLSFHLLVVYPPSRMGCTTRFPAGVLNPDYRRSCSVRYRCSLSGLFSGLLGVVLVGSLRFCSCVSSCNAGRVAPLPWGECDERGRSGEENGLAATDLRHFASLYCSSHTIIRSLSAVLSLLVCPLCRSLVLHPLRAASA